MLLEQRGRPEACGAAILTRAEKRRDEGGLPCIAGDTVGDRAYAKIIVCEQSGPPPGPPPRC